jgi:general L-amino acid transport system permease protein
MANLVFIPAPDLPPPPGQVGIIRWLKLNFFKDTFSSVLTLLGLYFIFWITGPLLSWFILDAVYAGDSAACNAAEGACWSFIRAQIKLFLFGLFPRDLLWRPILAAALLAITFALTATRIIPVLAMVLCWTALVLISYWLFAGGFGLQSVPTTKWGGLMLTLMLSVIGIVTSIPLGILLALGRRSKIGLVSFLSVVFIESIRGIPLVTILFMATILLPLFMAQGADLSTVFRVQIGIILFSTAYIAEVVRGGLQGIDSGQQEAADALGLSGWKSTALIILPQALANVLSPLIGRCIALLKDTSLVIVVGLLDFLGIAKAAAQSALWLGFEAEAFIFCAAIYWVLCFGLSRYGRSLEQIGVVKKH